MLRAALNGLVSRACQGQVDGWSGRVIRLCEVDGLVALVGDAHPRDDDVELATHQVRYRVRPLVEHPLAVQLCAAAQLVADLSLQTIDLAVVVDEVEGVVLALSGKTNGLRAAAARQRCGSQRTYYNSHDHAQHLQSDHAPILFAVF